jgi:hypothetical protein
VTRAALLLLLGLVALAGCSDVPDRCDAICSRFVVDCEFTAWSSVDQCAAGCVEDMYRRTDAHDVLDCYHAAVDTPTAQQSEARVDRALEAGLLGEASFIPFDRAAAVDQAMSAGTCDMFAVVQCKAESVQVPASGALLGR